MNKTLSRLFATIAAMATAVLPPSQLYAQATGASDLCRATGVALVYFNGIQATPDQADVALAELRRLHGTTSPTGDPIRYEKFYKYSSGFEDYVDDFEKRLQDQDALLGGRFELFFQALSGDGPWWSRIVDSVASTSSILTSFVDWYQTASIQNLANLRADPSTAVNSPEQEARIETLAIEGKKLLLVAHSQGNLFVNAAYDLALGRVTAESVKVVHIAPASQVLSGSHTLADRDVVIDALRGSGGVASVTDVIPSFSERAAGVNGNRDVSGHGLLEVYVNQTLALSTRVKGHITDALNALVAPQTLASSGFFSATLTWDGSGDADLHAFEPGSIHVFYASPNGQSGYLDVDETVGNGPEHYYASCDSNLLRAGTYRIAVANYSGAAGRKATVQVASWSDGVLGTKSVTLGADTGDSPGFFLFDVLVAKDVVSGKYKVSLVP